MDLNPETSSQSSDRETLCFEIVDSSNNESSEQSNIFTNAPIRIEKEIASINAITESLNKMREKAAALEGNLLSKVSCSTWKDISELIGLSCANILDDCYKILDNEPDKPS